MKKTALIVSSILIIALVISYLIWNNYRNSAQYALNQIENAITEKNSLKFERFVDIDALCEQSIDAILQDVIKEQFSGNKSNLEALGSALGLSLVEKIKPTFVSLLRSSIIESVELGDFGKLYEKTDFANDVSLNIIEHILEVSPDNLLDVSEINVEGSMGYFTMSFENDILDTTLSIRIKMEKENSNWRVSGFYNLENYMSELNTLKDAKLRWVNYGIRQEIDSIIEFGDIQRTESGYNYRTYIDLSLQINNISIYDTIDALYVDIMYFDEKLGDIYYFGIPPGISITKNESVKYNQFIDSHTGLRYGSLEPKISHLRISNKNGTKRLSEFESWRDYKNSLSD